MEDIRQYFQRHAISASSKEEGVALVMQNVESLEKTAIERLAGRFKVMFDYYVELVQKVETVIQNEGKTHKADQYIMLSYRRGCIRRSYFVGKRRFS